MDDFKNLFYYITASILAGLVAEFNEDKQSPTFKVLFLRGFTSVVIGIVVGLSVQEMVHNVNLAIAACSLASVGGYPVLTLLKDGLKKKMKDVYNSEGK